MSNNITTTNIHEKAAAFANNMANKLNTSVLNAAGVDVMWFRTVPQKRSSDVIFHTYTLYNVEPCPINMKVMYTDTAYNDAEIAYVIMGAEYPQQLCIEIPVNAWYEATNYDGTLPQKGDIVYIPLSNKLLDVQSMSPVASIAAQTTSFKMYCAIHKDRKDRHIEGDLKESIDKNTVSVDKLFGKSIEDAMLDLTDKKQTSQFSSTVKDEYKTITKNTDSKSKSILNNKKVINTISKDIEIDGHIVARTYYDMDVNSDIVVEYKNINDEISLEDSRCLSMWVNIQNKNTEHNIIDITEDSRDKRYVKFIIKSDIRYANTDDILIIKRGNIVIYSRVTETSNDTLTVKVPINIISKIQDNIPGWKSLDGFVAFIDNGVNLLSGESENGGMELNIYGNKFIVLNINNREHILPLNKTIEYDTWHGIIINLNATMKASIFKVTEQLELIFESEVKILWNDDVYDRYYLQSSHSYITNIRYYNTTNTEIDKQLTDLVTYNIKNNSKAIINDSADLYIENSYYGQQR